MNLSQFQKQYRPAALSLNFASILFAIITAGAGALYVADLLELFALDQSTTLLIAFGLYALFEVMRRTLFGAAAYAISISDIKHFIMLILFTSLISLSLIYASYKGAQKIFFNSSIYGGVEASQLLTKERDSLLISVNNSLHHTAEKLEILNTKRDSFLVRNNRTVTTNYKTEIEAYQTERLRLHDEKARIYSDYEKQQNHLHAERLSDGGGLARFSVLIELLIICALSYLAYYRYRVRQLEALTLANDGGGEYVNAPKVADSYDQAPRQHGAVDRLPTPHTTQSTPAPSLILTVSNVDKVEAVNNANIKASTLQHSTVNDGGRTLRQLKKTLAAYKSKKQTATVKARIKYYEYYINQIEQSGAASIELDAFQLSAWG